jgi:hypothetical protein
MSIIFATAHPKRMIFEVEIFFGFFLILCGYSSYHVCDGCQISSIVIVHINSFMKDMM